MTAAERKWSQWTPLELQVGPLIMESDPSCDTRGTLRLREWTEDKGKKGAEVSQLVSSKARPGAPLP